MRTSTGRPCVMEAKCAAMRACDSEVIKVDKTWRR
jgi:hypothetical protein